MERTVITFSAENIVTIFLMVAAMTAIIGFAAKLVRPKARADA